MAPGDGWGAVRISCLTSASPPGISWKPLEYKEHDFRTPPKFLTPLLDRVVVAGYAAALYCAVRGYPKPKVVWMKNKMEIREDPKFLMTNYQGILTLNIRRPSPFDSGTYSCLAVNELGEALAECKLDVRGEEVASRPLCLADPLMPFTKLGGGPALSRAEVRAVRRGPPGGRVGNRSQTQEE